MQMPEEHSGHDPMQMPVTNEEAAPGDQARRPEPMDPRPMPPYARLRPRSPAAHGVPAPDAPVRTIRLRLTGNMTRYVWSFDGRTLAEADEIPVRRGEVLRIELENTTMMHHPIHLHGHFFRVLPTDQAADEVQPRQSAPWKHTVDVAPMQTTTIEFLADADKDWFFHCHVLYHMKAGMSRIFHYEGSEPDADLLPERRALFRDPIYAWANASVMSHFTEGIVTASTTRHELAAEWEIGWQNIDDDLDHEVLGIYRYHWNRFYRAFAGASLEDERDAAVFGIEALLPLNLDGRAWVDSRGHGRFALAKELALTTRLFAVSEVEYDTDDAWEGSAGLRLRVHRHGSLAFEWHSEFGFGGGVELIY
jgi:hypothetical protein